MNTFSIFYHRCSWMTWWWNLVELWCDPNPIIWTLTGDKFCRREQTFRHITLKDFRVMSLSHISSVYLQHVIPSQRGQESTCKLYKSVIFLFLHQIFYTLSPWVSIILISTKSQLVRDYKTRQNISIIYLPNNKIPRSEPPPLTAMLNVRVHD